jgi:hypothetical protein
MMTWLAKREKTGLNTYASAFSQSSNVVQDCVAGIWKKPQAKSKKRCL